MKKLLLCIVLLVGAYTTYIGFNVYSQKSPSALILQNIEALSNNENDIPKIDCIIEKNSTCPGRVTMANGDVYEVDYTDHKKS